MESQNINPEIGILNRLDAIKRKIEEGIISTTELRIAKAMLDGFPLTGVSEEVRSMANEVKELLSDQDD